MGRQSKALAGAHPFLYSSSMRLDPHDMPPRLFYQHMVASITPRPIAWVSTVSPAGVPNLAPFSFFNGVGACPPSVVFCPTNRRDGSKKDTLINVEWSRQFAVNIVSHDLGTRMNQTSAELEYEHSEFEYAGLTPIPCDRIKPPRVKEASICMECEVHAIVTVGDGPLAGHAVIGRIVLLHIDDGVLNGAGQIDPAKLDTIGRMGGALYTRTRDRFELPRPELPPANA
jgi:flavin reductase (DIM6/NTAB) family NADH-FMN oxidoreductase RutF